jgi:hypothetical protein
MFVVFEEKDIFNADVCGLLFQAMPGKTLATKGDRCKSGSNCKVR